MSEPKQKYITRCNIHDVEGHPCGQHIATTSGINVPTVGESPAEKTKLYVQAVVQHLMTKHQPHCGLALNTMEQFLAYSVLGFTLSEDPGVSIFMAGFAEYLCRIATMPVSDEMIVELVTHMGCTMEDPQRAQMIQALTYLRNFQIRKLTAAIPSNSPVPA